MIPDAALVVVAAGRGERLGAAGPKALVPVGGAPLLTHAVMAGLDAPSVSRVVVAAPEDALAETRAVLAGLGGEVVVVAGGDSRQESVRLALAAVPADTTYVLVHDAARALTPSTQHEVVLAALRAGADAVVPGLPLADTVKRVDGAGAVMDTPDRATLRAVQTPQGFRRDVLARLHTAAAGSPPLTDDAALAEAAGIRVVVVPGHVEAFKVTHPLDLLLAEAVLADRAQRSSG